MSSTVSRAPANGRPVRIVVMYSRSFIRPVTPAVTLRVQSGDLSGCLLRCGTWDSSASPAPSRRIQQIMDTLQPMEHAQRVSPLLRPEGLLLVELSRARDSRVSAISRFVGMAHAPLYGPAPMRCRSNKRRPRSR